MERLNMESVEKISLLYDFYGGLLTEKQRQVMELYHEENLSLAEIAQEFGISRQGVHDTLKKAEHLLTEYENKLGLVAKLMKSRRAIAEIDGIIDGLTVSARDNEAAAKLQQVKDIINRLEE
ncbi:MAG: YlxM family DNA-binding protein [Firmicutes bacterium]|nr:YlxM family DNA-binding protein [Bacillota bacterium]